MEVRGIEADEADAADASLCSAGRLAEGVWVGGLPRGVLPESIGMAFAEVEGRRDRRSSGRFGRLPIGRTSTRGEEG